MMKVRVKLFAFLADQLGSEVEVDLPSETTVSELKKQIEKLNSSADNLLENCRVAINQEFVDSNEIKLTANDEIAIIPPVSGG